MTVDRPVDWDPRSDEVLVDQIAAYDEMRARCPVPFSPSGNWAVLRHDDVVTVLDDPVTYSNSVSQHLSVPNGMDPPEHTIFRTLVDRYYDTAQMAAFEPTCRQIVRELIDELPRGSELDFMSEFAEFFANRLQCAFMGWPDRLRQPLRDWTKKNHRATLATDRAVMSAVAMEFDSYIHEQLDERRAAGQHAPDDATTALLQETVEGRALTDEEIVSIVRNWTVGELGTIAASIGIIGAYLAEHPELQTLLRADPSLAERASDEILRIHPPLIANRRRTTCPVQLGGREIPEGERLVVVWASANRDEETFGDPDEFRLDRDLSQNLLYGRGVHYCPGAPLARLELRVFIEEILAATTQIKLGVDAEPINAHYPASGYAFLPLIIS